MAKNRVNIIQIYDNEMLVGHLSIFADTYMQFRYDDKWLKNDKAFAIDPELALNEQSYENSQLWGCFADISPDRWGKLLQNRLAGRSLSDIEYMLGVSDYYRVGSLRLKINEVFQATTNDIPKLIHINKLMRSSFNIEKDEYNKQDLSYLIEPSSSLGGARLKASVLDKNRLYIAKFPSINDEHSVILWEKTLLDLAQIAGIKVPNSRLIELYNGKKALLVERFDRDESGQRIPFMSAMTLLKAKERQNADEKSYVDFAKNLSYDSDKQTLFKRMLFNALFGNTDDHLKNHALLFDRQGKEWHLSPAYDLNPNPLPYNRQRHALNFVDNINLPSIELCDDIKSHFAVDKSLFEQTLQECLNAGAKYKEIALKNGIKTAEIEYFKGNFEHRECKDKDLLKEFDKKLCDFINKKSILLPQAREKRQKELIKECESLKKQGIEFSDKQKDAINSLCKMQGKNL